MHALANWKSNQVASRVNSKSGPLGREFLENVTSIIIIGDSSTQIILTHFIPGLPHNQW